VADFLTGSALAAGVGLPIILMHTDVVRVPALPPLCRAIMSAAGWISTPGSPFCWNQQIDLGPMFMSMVGGAVVYLSVVAYVYVCHKGQEDDGFSM
jgi:hypothetical protein